MIPVRILVLLALVGVVDAQTTLPGYGGPAVASRGLRNAGSRGTEPASIRPFASLLASYDNGLINVSRDPDGTISNPGALYGIEATIGAYGTKTWRRTRLGLDYQGLYRHYNTNTYFNGSDHLLGLDFVTQLSRRSGVSFRTSAGTSSRAVGGLLGVGTIDPTLLGLPVADIFDNRTYFLESTGSYLLQIGPRNSMNFTGGGFAVRRQSKALIGMNGYRASGDFARRVTRNTTVGVNYQYLHIDYPRAFGEGDVHTIAGLFSRRLGRVWDISLGGGLSHTDFTAIQEVAVDPVVAELLGITRGREAFNAVNVVPSITAQVSRLFRQSTLFLNYTRGVSPGNGALLLSRQENATIAYTYNTGNRWTLSGNSGYNQLSGTGAYSGQYQTYNIGSGAGYRFWDDLYFTIGVDFRRINTTTFNRNGTRIMGGVTYSPGAIPFSFH